MISNEILSRVDTPENLENLFKAFGVTGVQDKINFLNLITNHQTGNCGVKSQDLQDTIEHFLKHEWQQFT